MLKCDKSSWEKPDLSISELLKNQVPLVRFHNIYHPASNEYTEVLNLTIGQISVKYEFVKYLLNMNLSYIC